MRLLTIPKCHSCQGKSRQQRLRGQLHPDLVMQLFQIETDGQLSTAGRKTIRVDLMIQGNNKVERLAAPYILVPASEIN